MYVYMYTYMYVVNNCLYVYMYTYVCLYVYRKQQTWIFSTSAHVHAHNGLSAHIFAYSQRLLHIAYSHEHILNVCTRARARLFEFFSYFLFLQNSKANNVVGSANAYTDKR